MSKNTKNEVIQKAWNIILNEPQIKKLYFIPWLLSILFLTLLLVYQVVYTYVEIFDRKDKIFEILLDIFHSTYFIELLIFWIIFVLCYIVIIPIFEWWLIYYLNQKNKGKQEISNWDILYHWIFRFLPFFEYSNLFSQFKFISVVNIYLFCLRFFGVDYIWLINYLFIFLFLLSIVINVLFAYSKYEIILNNKKSFEAISRSIRLSILNLWLTLKLYFFMFVLNIRVIINFLVFLIFPIIIISAITYITSQIFMWIAIILLSIVFFILIIILWYLNWVLEVFKNWIWYFAYHHANENLKAEEKDEKSE